MRIPLMDISTTLRETLMRFGDHTKIYYLLNHIFMLNKLLNLGILKYLN
jgi:hypothetical protein